MIRKQTRTTVTLAGMGLLVLISLAGKVFVQPGLSEGWKAEGAALSENSVTLEKTGSRIVTRNGFKNFALSFKVKTTPGAEARVAFHSNGNPSAVGGYQVVINNSDYRLGSAQKTGSLARIRNNYVRTAADGDWFTMELSVKGKEIRVTVNGKMVSEYVEPVNPKRIKGLEEMILSQGLISVEKTSVNGSVEITGVKLISLSADIPPQNPDPLTTDATGDALNELNMMEFPVIDFHGHLKGGLTVDQVCSHGRLSGYNYGLAPNCGLHFPVTNDSSLAAHYVSMEAEPVFKAMQCEGREWVTLFTAPLVARYDYIFTDAMTWTDHKGRRMRLWMPDETFVEDEQDFMDMLVGKIEAVMSQEPVDIYVNPTFLPAVIADRYDQLWTAVRMDRVIKALKDNDVALEINARYNIPSIEFIRRAKAAGLKFTFGTNNVGNTDLNRLEYCLKAIKETGILPADIFLPRPAGDKKVLKMGLPAKITG